jgi:hypothetical protein
MTDPTGIVDNGRNVAAAFSFYVGRGGLVQTDRGWQLALQCLRKPNAANWKQPGTIDGKAAQIADVVEGQAKGMFVFTVGFPDGEPAPPAPPASDAPAEPPAA